GSIVSNFLSKYNSNGALQWTWLAGAPDTSNLTNHTNSKVIVDSTGSPIFIYYLASDTNHVFVSKLTPGGALSWTASLGGPFTCMALAIGPSDEIAIGGALNGGSDMHIYKLSSSGQSLLNYSYVTGQTALGGKVEGLAYDPSGNLFASGTSNSGDLNN